MNIAELSIKRPILVSMFLIVFIIFGILSYMNLDLDLAPQVDIPFVNITTVYPGSGPEEVETEITKPIEDAVSAISGINVMRSYCLESVSIISIEFNIGKDGDVAAQEVRDKIDAILNDLPDDADLPIIQKLDVNAEPILDVLLTGPMDDTALYEIADKKVADLLSQVRGVATVDIFGGAEREIRVELDNRVVFKNALSLPGLAHILAAENMDMPGGNFLSGTQEYTARLNGMFGTLQSLRDLEIPTQFGPKKLGDLATVVDGSAEIRKRCTFFDNQIKERDHRSVLMTVSKTSDGNTVDLVGDIRESLPEIDSQLPAGCSLRIVNDQSVFIESSVEDTLSNIFLGVLLTALILMIFLHNVRATIIVAIAMPFSIISTFLLMQISGFTLNIMSLMGLSTAVGVLVTNSVVVIESIFRARAEGVTRKEAASIGTARVATAVIASTLTNIVVFLPIANMSSLAGQFFKEFALTVTYATLFSLLVSFTLTPMMASRMLTKGDNRPGFFSRGFDRLFGAFESVYRWVLQGILSKKWRALLVVLAALACFSSVFFMAEKVGAEFFPLLDEGDIDIQVELPEGSNLDATMAMVSEIEDRVSRNALVKHVLGTIGQIGETDIGPNLAVLKVKLVDRQERDRHVEWVASEVTRDLATLPNAKIRVAAVSQIGSGEAPIQMYLQGPDLDVLRSITTKLTPLLKRVPGLINLQTSLRTGKPEVQLEPNREALRDAGLTVADLAFALRASLEGIIATQYRDAGEEYDIRITLNDEGVDSLEEISRIPLVSPKGVFQMAQLADIHYAQGVSKIIHKDKSKSVLFTGYTAPGYALGDVVAAMEQQVASLNLEPGYGIFWTGDTEYLRETALDMLRTFIIAVVLTYMLLAAILESLKQPLLIMATVPLALVGVFGSLWLTGLTLNLFSMMAIIMLLGIVVNNAILILDHTNQLTRSGEPLVDALLVACTAKLRPILMSSLAIILGMLPMAIGLGSAGREFRQPMGVVSIGGLLVSTVLTLVVIPSVLTLVNRDKKSHQTAEVQP